MRDGLHRMIGGAASRLQGTFRGMEWPEVTLFLIAVGLAVALRLALLDFRSLDFYASLKPWYNAIKDTGFSVLATNFSTYNPPYLYLLYVIARFLPDTPVVVAVKLPSLVADFACAILVFGIVRTLSKRRPTYSWVAAVVTLFAPTAVLNSAFWGQADSIFTAGILACVYSLLIRRPTLAVLGFAIALAFKLQAVFIAPVLLVLLLRGSIPWKSIIIVPLVLFLAILPSWIAGRPLADLIGVYAYQASQFEFITMNAPSVYAFLPDTKQVFNRMYVPGVIMGGAAAFGWFCLCLKSRRLIEGTLLVRIMLAALLVVPLFLPKMHERYFFAADMLAIALAFSVPRLFWAAIVISGVSFFSYQPFLFERQLVSLEVLALVLTATTALLIHDAVQALYGLPPGDIQETNAAPAPTVAMEP